MYCRNMITFALALFLFIDSLLLSSPGNDKFWGSSKKEIGAGLQNAERLYKIPAPIRKLFLKKNIKVFTIDLDSDGKRDYIISETDAFRTCFADSRFHLKSCEKIGQGDGFSYYYFVKLDSDPMLKLFDFSGDEDYSDFKLYSFSPKTWKLQFLSEVHPYIEVEDKEHRGIYWGYPWDITGIRLMKNQRGIHFFGVCEKFKDDMTGETGCAAKILFRGTPTQGEENGSYTDLKKRFKPITLKQMLSQRNKCRQTQTSQRMQMHSCSAAQNIPVE